MRGFLQFPIASRAFIAARASPVIGSEPRGATRSSREKCNQTFERNRDYGRLAQVEKRISYLVTSFPLRACKNGEAMIRLKQVSKEDYS